MSYYLYKPSKTVGRAFYHQPVMPRPANDRAVPVEDPRVESLHTWACSMVRGDVEDSRVDMEQAIMSYGMTHLGSRLNELLQKECLDRMRDVSNLGEFLRDDQGREQDSKTTAVKCFLYAIALMNKGKELAAQTQVKRV